MCKDQCNSFLSRIRGNGSELDNSNRMYATCALVSFCTCETSFLKIAVKKGAALTCR
jgi:hypothetical protein